jgi:hypothetical protein
MTGISYFLAVMNSGYFKRPLTFVGRSLAAVAVVNLVVSADWTKMPRNIIAAVTLAVLVYLLIKAKRSEERLGSQE